MLEWLRSPSLAEWGMVLGLSYNRGLWAGHKYHENFLYTSRSHYLSLASSLRMSRICFEFADAASCRFGDACRFQHITGTELEEVRIGYVQALQRQDIDNFSFSSSTPVDGHRMTSTARTYRHLLRSRSTTSLNSSHHTPVLSTTPPRPSWTSFTRCATSSIGTLAIARGRLQRSTFKGRCSSSSIIQTVLRRMTSAHGRASALYSRSNLSRRRSRSVERCVIRFKIRMAPLYERDP